jgi:hypothetical protein
VQKTSKDRRFEAESEKREKKIDEMSFGWGIAALCLLRKIQGNFILGRKAVALLHNVAAVMTSVIRLVAPY